MLKFLHLLSGSIFLINVWSWYYLHYLRIAILSTYALQFGSCVSCWSNRGAVISKMEANTRSSSGEEMTPKKRKKREKRRSVKGAAWTWYLEKRRTTKRWEIIRICVKRWLCLSVESKTIAETNQYCITMDFNNAAHLVYSIWVLNFKWNPSCFHVLIGSWSVVTIYHWQ